MHPADQVIDHSIGRSLHVSACILPGYKLSWLSS